MADASDKPVPVNYLLEPGFIYLPSKPAAVSTVLGSSVAVCLFDGKRKVGGMNHYQYPVIRDRSQATSRYGNVATLTLIQMMLDNGSKLKHLKAQIFGGAHNREPASRNIGAENIRVARKILNKKKIPVVSEDVGGEIGRKIVYKTDSNETIVIKVENIRAGDWFPYESHR